MKIIQYKADYKQLWDDFVDNSKNTHFFFKRDYMEYHSDRFKDYSLLVFDEKDNLKSIFPANINNNIVYSHQGLTFGGFLLDDTMSAAMMLKVFEVVIQYLKNLNIRFF